MVDIARAVVRLEADNTRLQRDLDKANSRIKRFQGQLSRSSQQTARAVTSGIVRPLAALTAGFSAGALVKGVIDSADSYQLLQGRLKLVTASSEELAQVNEQLFAVAQRTRAPLQGVADLYIRLAGVSKELKVGQQDLIKFTEGVGNALTLSGTSAEGSSGALLQLSQAIGGGIVRAEEFNSILEGAPVIVQTVAKNLDAAGGSVSRLRTLVNDGKVSSREFFDAFQEGAAELGASAQSIPRTVGQALTQLRNEFARSIGTADTSPLIAAIDDLREKVKDPDFQRRLVETANNIVTVVSALASAGAATVGGINSVLDSFADKKRRDDIADLSNKITALKREISERENAGGILEVFGRDPNAELAVLRTQLDQTTNSLKNYVNAAVDAAVPRVQPLVGADVAIPLRPGGPAPRAQAVPPPEECNTVKTPRAAKKAVDEWATSLEAAAAIQAEIERMDEQRNKLLDEANAIWEATRTPLENYRAELEKLDMMRARFSAGLPGGITDDTYRRAVGQLNEELARTRQGLDGIKDKGEDAFGSLSVYADQAAREMQDALAEFLFDPFSKGLDGMLEDFADMLQRMAAQAAAAQIFEGFKGKGELGGLLGPIGSAVGGFFGGGGGTADGAIDFARQDPFGPVQYAGLRDSGGPGMPGQAYAIGTGAQPELFIPDTAGTFVPRDQWMGGAAPNITINIPITAPAGTVGRQTLDQISAAALSGASRALRRNG